MMNNHDKKMNKKNVNGNGHDHDYLPKRGQPPPPPSSSQGKKKKKNQPSKGRISRNNNNDNDNVKAKSSRRITRHRRRVKIETQEIRSACCCSCSTSIWLYLTLILVLLPSIWNIVQSSVGKNSNYIFQNAEELSMYAESFLPGFSTAYKRDQQQQQQYLNNLTRNYDQISRRQSLPSTSNTADINTTNNNNSKSTTMTTTSPSTLPSYLQDIQISRQRLEQRIPPWLLDYFDWQQDQLSQMTADNWNSGQFRFLISRCTAKDYACGGISDRLKPLPVFLRVAYMTKRIFMIRWTNRPHPLEEFLVPTQHFNWSVPEYMQPTLKRVSKYPPVERNAMYSAYKQRQTGNSNGGNNRREPNVKLNKDGKMVARGYVAKMKSNDPMWDYNINMDDFLEESNGTRPIILEAKKQMGDGGKSYFTTLFADNDSDKPDNNNNNNNNNNNDPYRSFFHGMFRALFQPSPGVAELLKEPFERKYLTPGNYTVAHYRSFYAKKMDQVPRDQIALFAKNAIHCASQLPVAAAKPTTPNQQLRYPIYFASDSSYASETVREYAQELGVKGQIFTNFFQQQQKEEEEANSNSNSIEGRRLDPLHLDFAGRGNQTWPPEAFYDTFVDLLLLANSKCTTYGKGGYGEFANILSFDPECFNKHQAPRDYTPPRINACEYIFAKEQEQKRREEQKQQAIDYINNNINNKK